MGSIDVVYEHFRAFLHGTGTHPGAMENVPVAARSLLAGAFSGIVETSITHPIDLSKCYLKCVPELAVFRGAMADGGRNLLGFTCCICSSSMVMRKLLRRGATYTRHIV